MRFLIVLSLGQGLLHTPQVEQLFAELRLVRNGLDHVLLEVGELLRVSRLCFVDMSSAFRRG